MYACMYVYVSQLQNFKKEKERVGELEGLLSKMTALLSDSNNKKAELIKANQVKTREKHE